MLKTTIPFIDLRGKTPVDLLRSYPDKAQALLKASRRTFGLASYVASIPGLVYSDRRSLKWLRRRANPFLHEIEAMADILRKPGIGTLNLSYEWACTSGAYVDSGTVKLLRVLDWPFPSLGAHVVVTLQRGAAGDYFNATWPGLSGMFQGMAPGRFSACINQAPMRKHRLGFAGDWVVNRVIAGRQKGLPPAHLLRQVFEQAADYAQAKDMLTNTKLAVPAIFVLSGLKPGQGCVIERLENSAEVRELSASQMVTASNEFMSGLATKGMGWRPRAIDSAGRFRQSETISQQDIRQDQFGWLKQPMINSLTRLVMLTDARTGSIMVQGYEGQVPVTELFTTQAVH